MIAFNQNKSIAQNAYSFWEITSRANPIDDPASTAARFTASIYEHYKKNTWWGLLVYLFGIESKVQKALSAYKFDLIKNDGYLGKNGIFSADERKIINDNVVRIFKKILVKPEDSSSGANLGVLRRIKNSWHNARYLFTSKQDISLLKKAERWDHKVIKYANNLDYMIASFAIFKLTKCFPKSEAMINQLKAMGRNKIEIYADCLSRYQWVGDGLKSFLENPNIDISVLDLKALSKALIYSKVRSTIAEKLAWVKSSISHGLATGAEVLGQIRGRASRIVSSIRGRLSDCAYAGVNRVVGAARRVFSLKFF